MEIRVKERLTGAVILVALIVLLVPELLSGPHGARQVPTRAADAPPERSFTVDLTDGPRKSSAAVPQPEAPDPAPVPASTPTPVAAAALPEVPASVPPPPSGSAAAAPESTPSKGSRGSTASKVAGGSTAATGSAASKPGAPVKPRAAPASVAHVAPQTHGHAQAAGTGAGWSIQVGSFTSRENAEHLANELRARNFVASVSGSTSNGRKLYRVRVGSEPDRASAQALATRLRAAGHSGSIVPAP